jgi:hypothetical protein
MSDRYINEDEPLEVKVTPAQPAFTSTGMQLSITGKIHPELNFESSMIVDDTSDEHYINECVDRMRRVFERQQSVIEHRMTRFDLANKTTVLREVPKLMDEWSAKRDRDRRIEEAKWQIAWNRSPKRGEFRINDSQRNWLDTYDAETKKKMDEFQSMLETYPADIKNLEARVDRCRRVIEGLADRTDLIDDLLPPYTVIDGEAAE